MKTLIMLSFFVALVSCGRNAGNGNGSNKNTSEISSEITPEERALVNSLIEGKSLSEKEVVSKLLSLKNMNETVIARLDSELEINCIQQVCEIKERN